MEKEISMALLETEKASKLFKKKTEFNNFKFIREIEKLDWKIRREIVQYTVFAKNGK